jgi:hypothetical protein
MDFIEGSLGAIFLNVSKLYRIDALNQRGNFITN